MRLALRRHEVGGLLYIAARNGRHAIAPDDLEALTRNYAENAVQQARTWTRLAVIAERFAAAEISWMVLKGAPLAAMLYADPASRRSSDIDILVKPAQFSAAARALQDLGYIASNPPLAKTPLLRRITLAAARDLALIEDDDQRCAIELHQRLFFVASRRLGALKLSAGPGPVPSPLAGPALVLYLILHGAVSYWVRLKWLLDLLPLLTMLSDSDKRALTELARDMRAEASLAASLSLLRALFPAAPLGPLADWTDARCQSAAVQIRATRYAEMLSQDRDWRSSPLDNRALRLEANWRAFESSSVRARILFLVPVSSLVRKVAGSAFKADRALTLSHVPP